MKAHDIYSERLKDARLVKEVLIDALMENDIETFQDVLIAHLRAAPKTAFSRKSGLGRQTLYDLIDDSKEFNQKLSNMCPVFLFNMGVIVFLVRTTPNKVNLVLSIIEISP